MSEASDCGRKTWMCWSAVCNRSAVDGEVGFDVSLALVSSSLLLTLGPTSEFVVVLSVLAPSRMLTIYRSTTSARRETEKRPSVSKRMAAAGLCSGVPTTQRARRW